MKITLWQQFSSNHSGYFGVVGAFESVEAAIEIEERIIKLLTQIRDWHREHTPDYSNEPTAIEKQISNEYVIENWGERIDWLDSWTSDVIISKAIERYDRVVYIGNPDQTWMNKSLYEELLTALGANLTAGFDLDSVEEDQTATWMVIDLTCSIQDQPTQNRLIEKWSSGLSDFKGSIKAENSKLLFEGVSVHNLTKLIVELEEAGCKEISYKVSSVAIFE